MERRPGHVFVEFLQAPGSREEPEVAWVPEAQVQRMTAGDLAALPTVKTDDESPLQAAERGMHARHLELAALAAATAAAVAAAAVAPTAAAAAAAAQGVPTQMAAQAFARVKKEPRQ